jgi:hypothetical protein
MDYHSLQEGYCFPGGSQEDLTEVVTFVKMQAGGRADWTWGWLGSSVKLEQR